MKTKLIREKLLRLYPECIPGAKYERNHAFIEDGKYVIFAGEIVDALATEVVVHEHTTHVNVVALQIILSYGQKLDYRIPMLHILMYRPWMTMSDMCTLLHTNANFVEKHLRIPKNTECGKMPLSNIYWLSKVKKPSDVLRTQAETLHPTQFGPLAAWAVKEQSKKKKCSNSSSPRSLKTRQPSKRKLAASTR